MATIQNKVITLDSPDIRLTELLSTTDQQRISINDLVRVTKQVLYQNRINNMYNANAQDLIIDNNIFENDEIN